MKRRIIIPLLVVFACLGLTANSSFQTTTPQDDDCPVSPDVIVLAEKAALGKVTFNHGSHNSKNYNIDGTAPVTCVECHHVEQPASEVVKLPPLKTAYPADRTVTLTAETFREPDTPKVTTCRSCHIPKNAEPTILTEIPQIEESGKTIVLTNQNAFHTNCAGCHAQVVKARPNVKPPTAMKCTTCHKRG